MEEGDAVTGFQEALAEAVDAKKEVKMDVKFLKWLEQSFTKMRMLPIFMLWLLFSVLSWVVLVCISLWFIPIGAASALIVTFYYMYEVSNTPEGSLSLLTAMMNPFTLFWYTISVCMKGK